MLEKMARAINQARLDARHPFFHIDPEHCDYSKHLAKAALQSLKDLDEGTVEAMAASAAEPGHSATNEKWLAHIFTAAINHILRSGE